MHGVILQRLDPSDEPYDLPADEPMTLASYAAGPAVEIYVEHVAIGAALPDMPLFLRPDRYINILSNSPIRPPTRACPPSGAGVLEEADRTA